jgi:hypothetical protein
MHFRIPAGDRSDAFTAIGIAFAIDTDTDSDTEGSDMDETSRSLHLLQKNTQRVRV